MNSKAKGIIVSAVAAAMLPMTATPASAGTIFSQRWDSLASARASHDFKPGRSSLHIGGRCSNLIQLADYFYVQLKKSSTQTKVFSSYSYPCNNVSYTDQRWVSVEPGTKYYLKWFGQNEDFENGVMSYSQGVWANY